MLKEISMKKLFTIVGTKMENFYNCYEYMCMECYQAFSANWEFKASKMSWNLRGNHLHCPWCGKHHDNNILYTSREVCYPLDMKLKVRVLKNKIILSVQCNAFEFGELYKRQFSKVVEVFIFDFDRGKTYFRQLISPGALKEYCYTEVNQKSYNWIVRNSMLRVLDKNCLEYKNTDITRLIRELRAEFEKKTNVKHSYVNGKGKAEGLILRQLFVFSSILNDSTQLGDIKIIKNDYTPLKSLLKADCSHLNKTINSVFNKCDKGIDLITALVQTYNLPECRSIRNLLKNETKLSIVSNILLACSITNDVNHIITLAKLDLSDIIVSSEFFRKITTYYDMKSIINMMRSSKKYCIADCARIYGNLSEDTKKQFWKSRPRVRNMHDSLTFLSYNEKVKNKVLALPPKHILKRMQMQIGLVRFFLPTDSKELFFAGKELKNCVASYINDIDKDHNIVLMSDNKGKLVACVEIKNMKIVLFYLKRCNFQR